MTKDEEADITTDVCPKCGGVFLDKGELNVLATGMTGDIEYCSIDHDFHKDRFPPRLCPKCSDKQMTKINLLRLSDLIFDYCSNCGGFFLDKGEVTKMNQELKSFTPNKNAEEYRATHGDHLVRVDQTTDVITVGSLGVSTPAAARYIRVSVFFSREMPPGIRVFQENWPMKLAKGLGLFWGQDIKTGDERFDSAFRVQGQEERVVTAFLDKEARDSLVSFVKSGKNIYSLTGSLDITSSGVVYVEGPYIPNSNGDTVKRSEHLIEALVDIADKIETLPTKK